MRIKGFGCKTCPVKNCGIFVRYGGVKCSILRNKAGVYRDPTTIAESIRAMSDEELAESIVSRKIEFSCFECIERLRGGKVCCDDDCKGHCLEWLQLPVDPGIEVSS